MSDSLWTHGLQHVRPLCPSPSPQICPSSCPLHQWCHPDISSSDALFSCPQSFPASGTFPMSQLWLEQGPKHDSSWWILISISSWLCEFWQVIYHCQACLKIRITPLQGCWEWLRAEGEEGIRGWDGWTASLMQGILTWANSGRWWGTGRPGVLHSMGLQITGWLNNNNKV